MHNKDIVHNGNKVFHFQRARRLLINIDIKANNILIEAADGPHGIVVERTQLTDLEDSVYCPPPGNLIGAQLGN